MSLKKTVAINHLDIGTLTTRLNVLERLLGGICQDPSGLNTINDLNHRVGEALDRLNKFDAAAGRNGSNANKLRRLESFTQGQSITIDELTEQLDIMRAASGGIWKTAEGHTRFIPTLSTAHLKNILKGNFGSENARALVNDELDRRDIDMDWRRIQKARDLGKPGGLGPQEFGRAARESAIDVVDRLWLNSKSCQEMVEKAAASVGVPASQLKQDIISVLDITKNTPTKSFQKVVEDTVAKHRSGIDYAKLENAELERMREGEEELIDVLDAERRKRGILHPENKGGECISVASPHSYTQHLGGFFSRIHAACMAFRRPAVVVTDFYCKGAHRVKRPFAPDIQVLAQRKFDKRDFNTLSSTTGGRVR